MRRIRTPLCHSFFRTACATALVLTLAGCASAQLDRLRKVTPPEYYDYNKGRRQYSGGGAKLFSSYYTITAVDVLGYPDAHELGLQGYTYSLSAASSGSRITLRSTEPLDPGDYSIGLQRVAETLAKARAEMLDDDAPHPHVILYLVPESFYGGPDEKKWAFHSGPVRVTDNEAIFSYPFPQVSLAPPVFNNFSSTFELLMHEVHHGLAAISRLRKRGVTLRARGGLQGCIYTELSATLFANCFQFALYGRNLRTYFGSETSDAGRNVFSDDELKAILADGGKAYFKRYRYRAARILYLTVWSGIFGDRAGIWAADAGYDEFRKVCTAKYLSDPANIEAYLHVIANDGRDAPEITTTDLISGFDPKRWRATPAPWVGTGAERKAPGE